VSPFRARAAFADNSRPTVVVRRLSDGVRAIGGRRRNVRGPLRIAELAGLAEYPLAAPDASRAPWPGEQRAVAGTNLFVRTTPYTGVDPEAAQPALYLHGLGGASTNFTDLADLLSPWLAGEAIDLPGFGHSGPADDGDYSIAARTRIVIRYLEQGNRGPVHLVANSMGGTIGIRVAATRPDLIRTLTLVSPAVPDLRPKKGSDALMPLLLVPGVGARMMAKLDQSPPEQRAKAIINLCFAHPERVPANRLAEAAEDVLARREYSWAGEAFMKSFQGLVLSYLRAGTASAWHTMSEIEAPTLVVWGELDRLVDVANAPRVAATIPDATLLVLPDIGHTAQLEDPVTTARAILALLARADATNAQTGVGV
jgi:pimeloyl-ACP methyl ester carboxylesterase